MSITDTARAAAAEPLPAPIDPEELARQRRQRVEKIARWVLPALVLLVVIWLWDRTVTVNEIPHYVLPGPERVLDTLAEKWGSLFQSWLVTLQITLLALAVAVIGGVGLAVLFNQSRWASLSIYPYAVILQVTPIVAIAPLIFIYVHDIDLWLFTISDKIVGMLICAWIVAFFPVLSNTTLGLNSADHNLRDLFTIYGASRWQRLRYLQLPSALPYFLGGLRIAGGLSLIGAVVAEFVAGTGGVGSGLAFRILEANYRLQIDLAFAALLMIAMTGVMIFAVLSLVSWLLLRKWHESAVRREV